MVAISSLEDECKKLLEKMYVLSTKKFVLFRRLRMETLHKRLNCLARVKKEIV